MPSQPNPEPQTDSQDVYPQNTLITMQSEQWSRVSPLAIIYFFAKSVYVLVSSFLIYSLPALAALYSKIKEQPIYLVLAVCGILGLILLSSIAKYWFYFYRFKEDRVEIKQGIFHKSHLDLPFNKIQNVKIVQPIYYRFNKYSYIELDTAGSAQQEAKIVALPLQLAESFKQAILQIIEIQTHLNSQYDNKEVSTVLNASESTTEVLLNERSMKDLVIHGISNNRVWIFLGVLAPFFNTIGEQLGSLLSTMGINLASYLDYDSLSMGVFVLHILSIALLIMLVIVLFSVIGSIFVFYQYRLSKLGDRYIRRSGLLTKHEVSMRLSRIQIAVQQQDWLDVLIKRTNLRFEQNITGTHNTGQAGNVHSASKLIVPSVTPLESMELIQDAFKVNSFAEIHFMPISKRFMLRMLAFPVLPLVAILITIATLNEFSLLGWAVATSICLCLLGATYLRWWRWGYHFEQQYVYIRKGFFGVNYYVFPIQKIQQVSYNQSLFMKNGKKADLVYVLASGSHKIPLIPQDIARAQVDEALLIVARDKPAWM